MMTPQEAKDYVERLEKEAFARLTPAQQQADIKRRQLQYQRMSRGQRRRFNQE